MLARADQKTIHEVRIKTSLSRKKIWSKKSVSLRRISENRLQLIKRSSKSYRVRWMNKMLRRMVEKAVAKTKKMRPKIKLMVLTLAHGTMNTFFGWMIKVRSQGSILTPKTVGILIPKILITIENLIIQKFNKSYIFCLIDGVTFYCRINVWLKIKIKF